MIADYYKILGVERDADIDEIKKAYRKLARATHPDTTRCCETDEFRAIKEAYETLSDNMKRKQYDFQLGEQEQLLYHPKSYQPFHFFDSLMNFGWFESDSAFHNSFEPSPSALEIILTPAEAFTGVEIILSLPVTRPCQVCWGSGGSLLFPCDFCNGEGFIVISHQMNLKIPSGARDGSIFYVHSRSDDKRLQIVVRVR